MTSAAAGCYTTPHKHASIGTPVRAPTSMSLLRATSHSFITPSLPVQASSTPIILFPEISQDKPKTREGIVTKVLNDVDHLSRYIKTMSATEEHYYLFLQEGLEKALSTIPSLSDPFWKSLSSELAPPFQEALFSLLLMYVFANSKFLPPKSASIIGVYWILAAMDTLARIKHKDKFGDLTLFYYPLLQAMHQHPFSLIQQGTTSRLQEVLLYFQKDASIKQDPVEKLLENVHNPEEIVALLKGQLFNNIEAFLPDGQILDEGSSFLTFISSFNGRRFERSQGSSLPPEISFLMQACWIAAIFAKDGACIQKSFFNEFNPQTPPNIFNYRIESGSQDTYQFNISPHPYFQNKMNISSQAMESSLSWLNREYFATPSHFQIKEHSFTREFTKEEISQIEFVLNLRQKRHVHFDIPDTFSLFGLNTQDSLQLALLLREPYEEVSSLIDFCSKHPHLLQLKTFQYLFFVILFSNDSKIEDLARPELQHQLFSFLTQTASDLGKKGETQAALFCILLMNLVRKNAHSSLKLSALYTLVESDILPHVKDRPSCFATYLTLFSFDAEQCEEVIVEDEPRKKIRNKWIISSYSIPTSLLLSFIPDYPLLETSRYLSLSTSITSPIDSKSIREQISALSDTSTPHMMPSTPLQNVAFLSSQGAWQRGVSPFDKGWDERYNLIKRTFCRITLAWKENIASSLWYKFFQKRLQSATFQEISIIATVLSILIVKTAFIALPIILMCTFGFTIYQFFNEIQAKEVRFLTLQTEPEGEILYSSNLENPQATHLKKLPPHRIAITEDEEGKLRALLLDNVTSAYLYKQLKEDSVSSSTVLKKRKRAIFLIDLHGKQNLESANPLSPQAKVKAASLIKCCQQWIKDRYNPVAV